MRGMFSYRGIVASGILSFVILSCLSLGNSYAHVPADLSIGAPDPFRHWKTLETQNFRINYQIQHQQYAQKMAIIAERVHDKTTQWLKWIPENKTEIIINDSFDGSNGGASTLPYNRFFIFMNTPVDGELQDQSGWLELVFTHEYIHILHLDQASGFPEVAREIVGRLFFTFPQFFNPKWITEGLAVYGETEKNKGIGRGQGAIFHAMMREEVAGGLRSLSELSYQGYRATDWPSGQVYLYGYYFFEFLESRYSKEKVIQYIQNWNKNIIPWRMSSRSQQIFGLTADHLWENYQQYLEEKFRPEIESSDAQRLNASWLTSGRRINSNPRITSEGEVYFYQSNGKATPSIEKIDKGNQQHHVTDIQGFSQFDWHDKQGILLSRGEVCDNTNIFADLYRWNAESMQWNRLTECGRYPRVAWRSDGRYIVAVHVENGRTNLELLDAAGKVMHQFPALPDGESLGDVDWYVPKVSADNDTATKALMGTIVAAVKRKESGWNIELFDLKNQQWIMLTNNNDLESKPAFNADGNAVYFISDHEKQQNVRKVRLSLGDVFTVSDTASYVKDFSIVDDKMVLMEYKPTGFGLQKVKVKNNAGESYSAQNIQRKHQSEIITESLVDTHPALNNSHMSDYNPWLSLKPRAWWASYRSDSAGNSSVQAFFDGSDALGFHRWNFAPQYFINEKELGGDASYNFYNRLMFLASRKIDIAQESNAEINQPEIKDVTDRLQAIWMLPFNSLENSVRIHTGIAQESVDRTIENDGVSEAEDNLLGLSLQFSNIERYVHSISSEDGRYIKLNFEKYGVFSTGNFSGPVATLDWREYISFKNNQVLSLRWVQGNASDSAKAFELGGNIDRIGSLAGNIGFGVSDYSLRGYSTNHAELIGRQMTLVSAEWRVPVIEVFNGWMSPPVGAGKTAMSVFVDTGKAAEEWESGHFFTGVGLELSPQILIGLDNFLLDTRLGFAQGLDDKLGETSVYISLGASF